MTGTVVKRGNKWASVVTVGTKINNKGKTIPNQKWKSFRTKKEAEAYTSELVSKVNRGEYIPDSKITVGEWLQKWLDVYIMHSTNKKIRTKENYKNIVEKHLIPAVGHIQLQKLTPTHLQNYYNNSPLSPKTLSMNHAVLHQALKVAMVENLITKNVAELVPEKPNGKKISKEMATWSKEEVKKILVTAKQSGVQTEAFYTLALDTGMRKGELCGLKWEDINFETGTVSVRRTLLKAGINFVLGTPKNNKGRNIPVSQITLELLRKWKVKQNALRLQKGEDYDNQDFVFTKKNGKPLQMNNLGENQFSKLIELAGVKKIRFHDMRHTAITLMLEKGINVKVIAERVGHADPTMILTRYSHVTPTMQKEIAQVMDDLLSH